MLTLAAELRAHGFEAQVLNLSTFTWHEAVHEIRTRNADLFGPLLLHRRPTRRRSTWRGDPPCPHRIATSRPVAPTCPPWPRNGCPTIRPSTPSSSARGKPLFWNSASNFVTKRIRTLPLERPIALPTAPNSPPLDPSSADLDALARPWEHFDYGFLITSRGCPGKCTFCCSPQLWQNEVRFRSAQNVLDELQQLVGARGHRFLHIKDDTFTAGRKRLLAICRGILERRLIFSLGLRHPRESPGHRGAHGHAPRRMR